MSSQNTSSENEEQVTLAKIFMVNRTNRSNIPVEWDGEEPKEGYVLLVYAKLSDSTYKSYSHYDSIKQKRIREHDTGPMGQRWGPYYESYECMRPSVFQASMPHNTSLLHYKNAHLEKPQLANFLPNLMSGDMSYQNNIDGSSRCRIYMFHPPSTPGLTSYSHHTVEPIKSTFWYKLNTTTYDKDKEIEITRHMRNNIPDDAVITIGEKEFKANYYSHYNYIPPNYPLHIFGREFGNQRIFKAKRLLTRKKLAGGKNNRKLIKKKINKRKKTRKIKQIRRRK